MMAAASAGPTPGSASRAAASARVEVDRWRVGIGTGAARARTRADHRGRLLADGGDVDPLPVLQHGGEVQSGTVRRRSEPTGGGHRVGHPRADGQVVDAPLEDRPLDVDHHVDRRGGRVRRRGRGWRGHRRGRSPGRPGRPRAAGRGAGEREGHLRGRRGRSCGATGRRPPRPLARTAPTTILVGVVPVASARCSARSRHERGRRGRTSGSSPSGRVRGGRGVSDTASSGRDDGRRGEGQRRAYRPPEGAGPARTGGRSAPCGSRGAGIVRPEDLEQVEVLLAGLLVAFTRSSRSSSLASTSSSATDVTGAGQRRHAAGLGGLGDPRQQGQGLVGGGSSPRSTSSSASATTRFGVAGLEVEGLAQRRLVARPSAGDSASASAAGARPRTRGPGLGQGADEAVDDLAVLDGVHGGDRLHPEGVGDRGFASTSTLTSSTLPSVSATTFSRIGPSVRHGPHHGPTGRPPPGPLDRSRTSVSKVASVTSIAHARNLPAGLTLAHRGQIAPRGGRRSVVQADRGRRRPDGQRLVRGQHSRRRPPLSSS